MCINGKKCVAWISLESVGIQSQGCLKDIKWLNSLKIPCKHSIFNPSIYIDLPSEKLIYIKNEAHGKFGYIDTATYDTQNRHLKTYVKRPIVSGKSLLYEACIQKLVGEHLAHIGFPTGAPRIVNIFQLNDNSICFSMEEIEGAVTLDVFLESVNISGIANVIIDCLLQLCAMIWYLNSTLGVNHRDLKPSNFLIVEHEPKTLTLQIETEIFEIVSKYSLTFIDFGFSCLGSTETQESSISLSTVYSKVDPCPKEGRDIYLFLAFLYIDFHTKLPSKLLSLFEYWLNIPGSNMCVFMRKNTQYSKKWIYFMAGNEDIKEFNCSPLKIIKDLQSFI
jgi:serine/threonine protein kinase